MTLRVTASRCFFTSDTHFHHRAAVKFRGFGSEGEMNEALIAKWNSVVSSDADTVFHLGDVSFGNNRERQEILYRLHGQIILIEGNHDKNGFNSIARARFNSIHQLLEIDVEEAGGTLTRIMLCHYAMRVWNKHHYGAWMLHGHSHGHLPPIGRQMDVGVDTGNDFAPYSFEQIKAILRDRAVHVVDQHRSDDRKILD